MPSLELSIVAMQHINWKLNLAWFLRYGDSLTEAQVASPRQCEFGRWLYSEGLERYGAYPVMAEIEDAHTRMHERAREVVRCYQAGDADGARAEYERVEELSEVIVACLSRLSGEIGD